MREPHVNTRAHRAHQVQAWLAFCAVAVLVALALPDLAQMPAGTLAFIGAAVFGLVLLVIGGCAVSGEPPRDEEQRR